MKAKQRATTLQAKLGFLDEDLKKPKHDEILKWLDENAQEVINQMYGGGSWDARDVERLAKRTLEIVEDTRTRKTLETDLEHLDLELDRKVGKSADDPLWKRYNRKKDTIEALKGWKGLTEELPSKNPMRVVRKTWEHPISSSVSNARTGYQSPKQIVGYVDMKIDFTVPRLTVTGIDFANDRVTGPINWIQTEALDLDYPNELKIASVNFEAKTTIPSLGDLFRQLNTYKEFEECRYVILCPDDSNAKLIREQGFDFYKYR